MSVWDVFVHAYTSHSQVGGLQRTGQLPPPPPHTVGPAGPEL